MVALVAALLVAVPPAHAQQPPQETQPSGGATFPESLIEGIQSIFRSIFGTAEGELPPPQGVPEDPTSPRNPQKQSGPQSPPQTQEAKPQTQEAKPAAVAAPPPAAVTPSAQAVPQSLQAAIAKGDYGNALKMIEQGVDIEAKDPGAGASALHYAVMKGEMPLVGLLIQRGADVNSRTKSGTTPLHTAVLYRRTEIAEYLIQKGADVNARSPSGATPLGLAIAADYHTLAMMLRSHGGR